MRNKYASSFMPRIFNGLLVNHNKDRASHVPFYWRTIFAFSQILNGIFSIPFALTNYKVNIYYNSLEYGMRYLDEKIGRGTWANDGRFFKTLAVKKWNKNDCLPILSPFVEIIEGCINIPLSLFKHEILLSWWLDCKVFLFKINSSANR